MRRSLLSLIILMSVFGIGTTASAASLYRNLSLGDTGEDVRALQQILNTNPATQIAFSGPGSPGSETNTFGPLTQKAVIAYQELYAASILTQIGLTRGTGYVGNATLLHMSGVSEEPRVEGASASVAVKPKIHSVSPVSGVDGTHVTLRGEGFLPTGNKVYASFTEFENLPSSDGTTISFTVRDPFPDDAVLPPFFKGRVPDFTYGFVVENTNGRSDHIAFILVNSKINNQ